MKQSKSNNQHGLAHDGSVMVCHINGLPFTINKNPSDSINLPWIWDDLPSPRDENTSPIAWHNGTAERDWRKIQPDFAGKSWKSLVSYSKLGTGWVPRKLFRKEWDNYLPWEWFWALRNLTSSFSEIVKAPRITWGCSGVVSDFATPRLYVIWNAAWFLIVFLPSWWTKWSIMILRPWLDRSTPPFSQKSNTTIVKFHGWPWQKFGYS